MSARAIQPGDMVRWIPKPEVRGFGTVVGMLWMFQNAGRIAEIISVNEREGVQRRWIEDGSLEVVP